MKRIIPYLFVITLGMITIGCSKTRICDPDAFSGSGSNPCLPQVSCEDYPDDSVVISWNDYNTCAVMNDYFRCHRKALEEHRGDTLRLSGWLDKREPYDEIYANQDYYMTWAILTDDESHFPEESYGIYVKSDEHIDFSGIKDKKIYITGRLDVFDTHDSSCCAVSPVLMILAIDTLIK